LKESVSSLNETEDNESFKKLLVASENFSEVHLSAETFSGLSQDELKKLKSANSQILTLRKQVVSPDEKDAIKSSVLEEISKTTIPEMNKKSNVENQATDVDDSNTKPLFDPQVKKTKRQRAKDGISAKVQAMSEKAKAIKDKIIPKQKPILRQ
jgi:hypothetical protein